MTSEVYDIPDRSWEEVIALLTGDEVLAGVAKTSRVGFLTFVTHQAQHKDVIIGEIWARAKEGKAPAKLVYVASSEAEALLMRKELGVKGLITEQDIGDGQPASDNPITICTARALVPVIQQRTWGANRTVVVNVHWYPTVDDEIALGHLVSWAAMRAREAREGKPDVHVAIVLLMTTFASFRTIEAFERHLRIDVQPTLCHDNTSDQVTISVLQPGWEEKIGPYILSILSQNRRVVIGTDDWESLSSLVRGDARETFEQLIFEVPSLVSPRPHDLPTKRSWIDAELGKIESEKVLAVNPELPHTFEIENLGLVVALGVAPARPVLDRKMMQVVVKERDLFRCEIKRQWYWSQVSATADGTRPKIMSSIAGVDINQRQLSAETLGPAWNRDFMFFALAAFESWPHCSLVHMPIRPPADYHVVFDATRRLIVLGCIEKGAKENTWVCTEPGRLVMKRYWGEVTDKHDFHLAYLLARTQLSQENPLIRRLLVRIAAIVHIDPLTCFGIGRRIDEEKLRRIFPPVIRGRIQAGFIWVALALYLRCEAAGLSTRNLNVPRIDYEGIAINPFNVTEISTFVKDFEKELGLEPEPPAEAGTSWLRHPLAEDQLLAIERHMMWAWLHRIALFAKLKPNDDRPRDCVTARPLAISMEKEPIVADHIQSYCDQVTKGRGAFYAFYLELSEGAAKRLSASQLTWIPPQLLTEVQEKTGLPWPLVVGKTSRELSKKEVEPISDVEDFVSETDPYLEEDDTMRQKLDKNKEYETPEIVENSFDSDNGAEGDSEQPSAHPAQRNAQAKMFCSKDMAGIIDKELVEWASFESELQGKDGNDKEERKSRKRRKVGAPGQSALGQAVGSMDLGARA
ncbi:hypothetical protein F5Y05DRAFT_415499 [Hypoxylon sp. FL0543]|nr:hypothetical protein F5Y05DRAFT_415499 [Hypoxylon sp. FL0543]